MIKSCFRGLTALSCILLIHACGGGGGGGDDDSNSAAPVFTRYVFATNLVFDTISSYAFDPDSGRLRYVATTDAGHGPGPVAVNAAGTHAYVGNISDRDISQFAIETDGSLSEILPRVASGSAGGGVALVIDPSGRYVYVANRSDDFVSQYRVRSDGSLEPLVPATVPAGDWPVALVVDPPGDYVYVLNQDSSEISRYQIGAGGGLTEILPRIATGTTPETIAIDPGGDFLYTSNIGSTDISQYAIGPGGSLTELLPRLDSGMFTRAITLDPAGDFAYVVDNNELLSYRVGADGRLVQVMPVYPVSGATQVSVDPSGRYVYALNRNLPKPRIFQFSKAADGSLLPLVPASVAAPGAVEMAYSRGTAAVSAFAANLYVSHSDDRVTQYRVENDGSLTSMIPPTVTSEVGGWSIALDPGGRFAWIANLGDRSVSQLGRDDDGALSVLAPAVGTSFVIPNSIAAYPTGERVFVTLVGTLSTFEVAVDGTLDTPPTDLSTNNPNFVAVDPTGHHVYVADASLGEVRQFDAVGSTLTEIGSDTAGIGTQAIAVDPFGRYLYAVNVVGDDVAQFRIEPDGTLVPLAPATVPAASAPTYVAAHPSGETVYVTVTVPPSIRQYAVAGDGTLSEIGIPLATGNEPVGIAVDPGGRYLYVANSVATAMGDYTLSLFRIDSTDGTLSAMPPDTVITTNSPPRAIAVGGSNR